MHVFLHTLVYSEKLSKKSNQADTLYKESRHLQHPQGSPHQPLSDRGCSRHSRSGKTITANVGPMSCFCFEVRNDNTTAPRLTGRMHDDKWCVSHSILLRSCRAMNSAPAPVHADRRFMERRDRRRSTCGLAHFNSGRRDQSMSGRKSGNLDMGRAASSNESTFATASSESPPFEGDSGSPA